MTCGLLLENGGKLLQENGGQILLENCDELLHGKIVKETRPRRRGRIIVDTPPEEEAPQELISKVEDHLATLMERVTPPPSLPIPDIQLVLSAADMRDLLEEDDEEALILILALAID